jgi:small GTP-binding protein
VEISAHGSPAVLREIVRAAIAAGARLAEPGEFTFRAYLGGRIDLVQAEAVGDLVDAVTPLQARVAFDQLEGTLTRAIAALDAPLFDLVARLEASIDFPDEGYHFVDPATVATTLRAIGVGIDRLLNSAHHGRVIREGRQIAIVGKPNVGKSSLFNWLLGTERAIVTDIPGTTRDLLRESVDFGGVRLSLVDTAGIREGRDEVEREGVARARQAHGVADLVFVVLDGSRPLDADDEEVLALAENSRRLLVVNKCDVPRAWGAEALAAACGQVKNEVPGEARTDHTAGEAPRGVARPDGGEGSSEPETQGSGMLGEVPRRTAAGRVPGEDPAGVVGWSGGGVEVSLKTGEGLAALREAIARALDIVESRTDEPLVTNIRHETLLREARESIARAMEGLGGGSLALEAGFLDPAIGAGEAGLSSGSLELEAGSFRLRAQRYGVTSTKLEERSRADPAIGAARLSEELVLADLAVARRAFEEVVGKRTPDEVLRAIFERFCIGK